MKKILFALLALAALLLLMWWLVPARQPAVSSAGEGAISQAVPVAGVERRSHEQMAAAGEGAVARELADYATLGAGLGDLPHSLQGTDVGGYVRVDADGRLIMSVGIKQMFNYFLSALGEESLEQIKGRIAYYLQQNLPAAAAQQGWVLLKRYLGYRRALADLPQKAPGQRGLASLRQTVQARAELRRSWMGQEATQAFFGPETAYDHYMLDKMALMNDQELSAEERQQRLHELNKTLPLELRHMMQETMAPVRSMETVQTMRRQGASDAAVQAYREEQFGVEAAQRLKELDARRAAWQQRYDDYRRQRQAIVTAGLGESDQAQQIAALRKRLFAADELKRVQALDHIASRQQGAAAN